MRKCQLNSNECLRLHSFFREGNERVELFNIEICPIDLCFCRHRCCLSNEDEISLAQRDEVRRRAQRAGYSREKK